MVELPSAAHASPLREESNTGASRNSSSIADSAAPSPADAVEQQGRRSFFVFIAKFLLCVGLLAWLIGSGRLELHRLAAVAFSWRLVVLIVSLLASMALPAIRWRWLLRVQGLSEPLGEVLRLTWVGYFAGNFLPGGAGGDIAKAYLIARGRSSLRLRAVSTVIVDRYIGLFSLVLLSCGSFVWLLGHDALTPGMVPVAATTAGLAVGMLLVPLAVVWGPARALGLALLPQRLRQLLRPLRDAWHLYRRNLPAVLGCLALSLASNSLVMVAMASAAQVLGFDTSPVTVFLVGPIMVLANCLPLTPGGAGVGEAAGERLFTLLELAGGAEIMLLIRIVMVLASAPAGLFLTRQKSTAELAAGTEK